MAAYCRQKMPRWMLKRENEFIVVEEKRIASPLYVNLAMRSFDTVKSGDSDCQAVSFVLQMLYRGLSMFFRAIHPVFFDHRMPRGLELIWPVWRRAIEFG